MDECVLKVNSGDYDSAFTAFKFQKFAWFKNSPINYNLSLKTPHPFEIEPVIIEHASLYVFKKEQFLKTNKRIAENHFIKFINQFEGHDINTDESFEIAELIVDSGMFNHV